MISYCHTQTPDELFRKTSEYLKNGTVNWVYTGVTKNPPESVTREFQDETTESQERDPNVERPIILEDKKYITPFTNIDKKGLADLYKQYNLTDTLFPLTRSCESLEFLTEHCGACWWCEERKWGFDSL